MDNTWEALVPTVSPGIKLEASPLDSLLSEPGGVYPSLFSGSTVASSAAATPTDTGAAPMNLVFADGEGAAFPTKAASFSTMSPLPEESLGDLASSPMDAATDDSLSPSGADASATSDKKPTKKRKSWGQVLPEPKTNLPPRKRAKTEDEKEQRRVERVLRNRRAAQSSRERKRLEVEALELRNQDLEEQLRRARRENLMLYQQLAQAQGKPAVVPTGNAPVTLSQELFGSQPTSALGPFLASESSGTINPVSLSPALHPVPDTSVRASSVNDQETLGRGGISEPSERQTKKHQKTQPSQQGHSAVSFGTAAAGPRASAMPALEPSPDMTQRPAATLCPDLQCLSAEESQVVLPAGDPDSFVLESGYLDSPESGNSDFNYLVGNDTVAAIPGTDFDINDFLNPDGPHHGGNFDFGDSSLIADGHPYHYSSAQIAPEDSDQQPHAGASLEGCDDAGIAVGIL